jgi:lysophospholipase L1-like esterase
MEYLWRPSFFRSRSWESSLAAAEFIVRSSVRLVAGALLLHCISGFLSAQQEFFLKDGDTVVFYGDSITERRIYSSFTETYVLTRFPKLNVRFVHSGWGGDTVAGGDGGSLQVRLQRDVIPYKPTVVTVLLGMNDGHYRALNESTYSDFTTGYESLVRTLKDALPQVRLTLLEPSPYDDVTRPPLFPGGYNGVLARFGQFISALGEKEKAMVVDLNSTVVESLTAVNAKDPSAARDFIPDRVHPGPAASLLMAEALLKSWNAPAIVTEAEIDAESQTVSRTVRTQVQSILRTGGTLSWTQNDEALPFPVDWQDSTVSVAAYSSDFIPAIDDQPLRVRNLKPGDYTLRIDGQEIATYPADQFDRGINLSAFTTPMLKQAVEVLKLTNQHIDLHVSRWRVVQVPLAQYGLPHSNAAITDLDALEREVIARRRAAAQPRPHFYEIVLKKSADSRN